MKCIDRREISGWGAHRFHPPLFYLPLQPTAPMFVSVCESVCVRSDWREQSRGENKRKSLLLWMFYAPHIMTVVMSLPASGYLLSHLQQLCTLISAVPLAKPAKPGALADTDKPPKARMTGWALYFWYHAIFCQNLFIFDSHSLSVSQHSWIAFNPL